MQIVKLTRMKQVAREVVIWLGLVAVLLASLSAFGYLRYGSIHNTLAAVRAETLIADSQSKSFGIVDGSKPVPVEFRLTNLSSRPIRILGSRTRCTCVAVDALPITIGPHQSHLFRLTIDAAGEARDIGEDILLYTNIPSQHEYQLSVVGVAKPKLAAVAVR